MMIADHRALAERGVELVELRLDWLAHRPDLNRLLADRPTPVVVTCRREADRGRWKDSEPQRQTILRSAVAAGVEYVDLEEDTARSIPRYGKTRRIISHHDFNETPLDLEQIHARLCQCDPDIVKLATMANSPTDNVRMLRLVAGAKVPTVGICMGELGVPSRILTGRFGAPFTYATFSSDRELGPGQLSFQAMQRVYRYDKISMTTKIYGVLGDPISHSLSPVLHNAAFENAGIDAVYVPFRVPKDALAATLDQLSWLGVQGLSVTLPHKEAVLGVTIRHDPPVSEIGAANTLYRDEEGLWRTNNTDYDAALESLKIGLAEPDEDALSPLAGKTVLMLGAGGVARAIGMGVVRAGGALTITNRKHARAVELAKHLGCKQTQWENRGAVFADILINCTPVGMHPDLDATPFAANWLREGTLVFDTIYNPERTLLIKQARERGCPTVSGVEMFVRQAARQFHLFTGRPAPLDFMRDTLRKAISVVKTP